MTGIEHSNRKFLLVLLLTGGAMLLVTPSLAFGQESFLTFTQIITDSIDDVDGLNGVNSIAVSPDGKHVYAASEGDFSVALFRRNSTSGDLTFVDIWRDGSGGVEGLDGARFVTLSPDGNNIYVASTNDMAIAVFKREPTDGHLTFIEVIYLGEIGFHAVTYVTVSHDGKDVYAVTQSRGLLRNSPPSSMIHFRRNLTDGRLTYSGKYQDGVEVESLDGLVAITISPDGKNVYTAAGNGVQTDKAVTVFSRNLDTGELAVVETEIHRAGSDDGLSKPISLVVSPDGQNVYIAENSTPYALATYARQLGTGKIDFVEIESDNVNGVEDMTAPKFVAMSPNGSRVYVAALASIVVFERDSENGRLDFLDSLNKFDVLDYPYRLMDGSKTIAISPDEAFVYLGASDGNSILTFKTTSTPEPQPFQINAGLSGAWYNSNEDGHGLNVIVLDENRIIIFWYVYHTDGTPMFLIIDGTNLGNSTAGVAYYSAGMRFGEFNPDDHELTVWGTSTLTFHDCNNATFEYSADDPVYGSGVIPMTRLAGVYGLECSDSQ